jgi:hypothetical protein
MWGLLRRLGLGRGDCSPHEDVVRVVADQATRLGIPPAELIARLKNALGRDLEGGDSSSRTARNLQYPDSECLDAAELRQALEADGLPRDRQEHLKRCSLCRDLVARARLDPERVRIVAERLAAYAAPTADSDALAHRQRAKLRQAQEASIQRGLDPQKAKSSTIIGRPDSALALARQSLQWAIALAPLAVVVLLYPEVIPTNLAPSLDPKLVLADLHAFQAVDFLATDATVNVRADGTIKDCPPLSDAGKPTSYVLTIAKHDKQRDFVLIDEKGEFVDMVCKSPNPQHVEVTGQLVFSKKKSPEIFLETMTLVAAHDASSRAKKIGVPAGDTKANPLDPYRQGSENVVSRSAGFRGSSEVRAPAGLEHEDPENQREFAGRLKESDVAKRLLVITLRDGKNEAFLIAPDVRVTVHGAPSEFGLNDPAIKPGNPVTVCTEASGRTVTEVKVSPASPSKVNEAGPVK